MTSRQKPKPYVVFHKDCADGMAAAYAAYRHFSGDAHYIDLYHDGTVPEFKDGADIYMVDFTFKTPVLLELIENHKVIIIDHHLSAAQHIEALPPHPNLEIHFDMNRSAATMAWEYWHPLQHTPPLYKYVEDRDIWTKRLTNSDEVAMAVFSYPYDFDTWGKLLRKSIPDLIAEGRALLRAQNKNIKTLIQDPRAAYIRDQLVPVVNAPYFLASDVGHELLKKYSDAPFAASYRENGKGERHWSLRSEDHRVDVSAIAVSLGGGGHRNAAGFVQKCWQVTAGTQVSFSFDQTYDSLVKELTSR
jgi:oligoribonuclease NrnB/cAMP/cGMP phosphodiesterase (DHH superfamily)